MATETLLEVSNLKKYFPIKGGVFSKTIGFVYAVAGCRGLTIDGHASRDDPLLHLAARSEAVRGEHLLQLLRHTGSIRCYRFGVGNGTISASGREVSPASGASVPANSSSERVSGASSATCGSTSARISESGGSSSRLFRLK